MIHGPSATRRVENAIRRKREIPRVLAEEPELWPGLELYADGFWKLCSDRQIGLAIGPIPWTSVQRLCDAWELDESQRDDMEYFISAQDSEYLKVRAEQEKSKS